MSDKPTRDERGRFAYEPREAWKVVLDPFDDLYMQMYTAINARLASATDEELDEIVAASKRPTQTNVGWTMFRVAEIVAEAAHWEQRRRSVTEATR